MERLPDPGGRAAIDYAKMNVKASEASTAAPVWVRRQCASMPHVETLPRASSESDTGCSFGKAIENVLPAALVKVKPAEADPPAIMFATSFDVATGTLDGSILICGSV